VGRKELGGVVCGVSLVYGVRVVLSKYIQYICICIQHMCMCICMCVYSICVYTYSICVCIQYMCKCTQGGVSKCTQGGFIHVATQSQGKRCVDICGEGICGRGGNWRGFM